MKLVLLLLAFITFAASKTNPFQELDRLFYQAALKSQKATCQKDSGHEFDKCMQETQSLIGELSLDFKKITSEVLEKNKAFYHLWNRISLDGKEALARRLNAEIQFKFNQLEKSKLQQSLSGLDKRRRKIPKISFGNRWRGIFKGKGTVTAGSAARTNLKYAFLSISIRTFLNNLLPPVIGITTLGLIMLMLVKADGYEMHRPEKDLFT